MNDRHGLLTAPISRVLLNMSLPNLIGILTVLGFSLIDTYFISQLGTDALAAISFTFPITLVVSCVAIGIGSGVSTNLGRLIGSGDTSKAKVFLHDALLATFFITFSVSVLGSIFLTPLFGLLGAEPVHIPLIKDYMHLWYLGAPILTLLMVGNQGLRATGDTRSPAAIMALAALINLILDPLLIFGIGPFPRLEIQGAAIASVLSWIIAASLSGYLLIIKRHLVEFVDFERERFQANWQQLAHIAKPAALMNLLNPIANALIMALLARIDVTSVAAFGAGVRLESVLLIVVMSLSSSLVPFIAQNLGAGQKQRAHQALMLSLKFVLVFQTLLYFPLMLLAQPIAELFSQDPRVLEWLYFYVVALPAAYGPLGVVILVATSLNAYHRPMSSLVLNICRLFVVMLPLALAGAYYAGVKGVLMALPVTNAVMGLFCYILAKQITEPTTELAPSTDNKL
ncbi:MATE family efflux transporter [Shewanella gelidii]|uniref:MATE family efflux transporter n=1 Tax=Shewanella gelidii TaxID=1642821 RepID=A0A917JPD1_9GAMM|nr:MATE family efflux transporter [Shewanella gelidii]MCL1097633.1 MATE family efflux transporter [Shewanella gelidii]GGI80061.1 MATE family efflux transporter [Shewanella gelidii]